MRIFPLLLLLSFSFEVNAQAYIKTEVIGSSNYRQLDEGKSHKIGNAKGAAKIYQAGISIPLSSHFNERNHSTLWSISAKGTYTELDNQNFPNNYVVEDIINANININYQRPIGKRWTMLMSLGGGIYTTNTSLKNINLQSVLLNAGIIFIYQVSPLLELGGGIALNNSFGYPMVFPALYLNWHTQGNYAVRISLLDGVNLSLSYAFNNVLKIGIIGEMNGQMALFKEKNNNKIFTHQYFIAGIRPEIQISKSLTTALTLGVSAVRPTEINNRNLNSMFKSQGYYFDVAAYGAIHLKVSF